MAFDTSGLPLFLYIPLIVRTSDMNVDMIYHISRVVFLEWLFQTRYSHLTCMLVILCATPSHSLAGTSFSVSVVPAIYNL